VGVGTTFVVVASSAGLSSSAAARLADAGYRNAGTFPSPADIPSGAGLEPALTFTCARSRTELAQWVELSSRLWPKSKIVALLDSGARHSDIFEPEQRVAAYLGMPIADEVLIQAVDLVVHGHSRILLMPDACGPVGGDAVAVAAQQENTSPNRIAVESDRLRMLSRRERELLNGVTSGQSNKRIALNFGLTEATVKVHMRSIFRKLGVSNRTQAACLFLGLIAITPPNNAGPAAFKHSASARSSADASLMPQRPRNE
jgi:two-component system nitrate/nitrite response regulator NarL